MKHFSIAYIFSDLEFLAQVKQHNDLCYDEPQINQENSQYNMTSKVNV